MIRRILPLVGILAGAFVLAPSAMAAQHIGACQLDGEATFDGAGLTVNVPSGPDNLGPAFTYGFSGDLTNCKNSDASVPATGKVSAGKTLQVGSLTLQEPRATGNGGCSGSHTAGLSFVQWPDGKLTIIDYSTDGALAVVGLQGSVKATATLPVINPQLGDPTELTVSSDRFAGDYAGGSLAFQPASPTDCQTGVKTAGIHGVIGTGNYA